MTSSTYPNVKIVRSACDLGDDVWETWRNDPQNANIIYAYALKAAKTEKYEKEKNISSSKSDIYLVSPPSGKVDLVIACMDGPLKPYPVFIYKSPSLSDDAAHGRLEELVESLLGSGVPKERVFAVFAIEHITKLFADIWYRMTGVVQADRSPYYQALLSCCTVPQKPEEPRRDSPTGDSNGLSFHPRRAVKEDFERVGELCKAFSEDSFPYILDDELAKQEATYLFEKAKLWVLEATWPDGSREIACIVAVTREAGSVSAITKVYTVPQWQRRGCAAWLVHHVCKEILEGRDKETEEEKKWDKEPEKEVKKSIVLYVGRGDGLATARHVYHKVGFKALQISQNEIVDGASKWLEIGFKGEPKDIGYW